LTTTPHRSFAFLLTPFLRKTLTTVVSTLTKVVSKTRDSIPIRVNTYKLLYGGRPHRQAQSDATKNPKWKTPAYLAIGHNQEINPVAGP